MNDHKFMGIACLLWATMFGFLETRYFGYNLLPSCDMEFYCDITTLILWAAGLFLLNSKPSDDGNKKSE